MSTQFFLCFLCYYKRLDPHKTQKWIIIKELLKFQRKYSAQLYHTCLPTRAGAEEAAELTMSGRARQRGDTHQRLILIA